MAVIEIYTDFGKTIAKPMRLVDIHDVQPMADEESINNSQDASAEESNQVSKDVGAACREAE